MRTLTSGMTSHLATREHSRAWMLRLDLADGSRIGLTSYDKDIRFDLADGAGTITYQSGTGARISDVELLVGLSPSNCEVSGPLAEVGPVTLEAVLGGRFNRATARLFQVNHRNLADGAIKILLGHVTEARPEGGQFFLEIRNEADKFNQSVGRVLAPLCDADYGDARCTKVVETITGTVTAVSGEYGFTVSFSGSYADDYFNFGQVEFTSGPLAGTLPVEIFDWTAAGVVTLFAPLAEAPAIGNTCTISRGCPKNRDACMARGNIANFRGFPELPGTDRIIRPAIPGQGND